MTDINLCVTIQCVIAKGMRRLSGGIYYKTGQPSSALFYFPLINSLHALIRIDETATTTGVYTPKSADDTY